MALHDARRFSSESLSFSPVRVEVEVLGDRVEGTVLSPHVTSPQVATQPRDVTLHQRSQAKHDPLLLQGEAWFVRMRTT